MRARLDGLEARLAEEEARGIARAARRVGGRRLDEDLAIEPRLRAAAEAALADATPRLRRRPADAVPALAGGARLALVVTERVAARPAADDRTRAPVPGGPRGGRRRDPRRGGPARPGGAARRILARAAWLPDLAACLAIQAVLPAGWIAVPARRRPRSSATSGSTLGAGGVGPRTAGRDRAAGPRGGERSMPRSRTCGRLRSAAGAGRAGGDRRRRGGPSRREPGGRRPPGGRGGGAARGPAARDGRPRGVLARGAGRATGRRARARPRDRGRDTARDIRAGHVH